MLSLEAERVLQAKEGKREQTKMDSFSTGSSGTGSPQVSSDEFMDQMKVQLAQAYAQEFLEVTLSSSFLILLLGVSSLYLNCKNLEYKTFFFLSIIYFNFFFL